MQVSHLSTKCRCLPEISYPQLCALGQLARQGAGVTPQPLAASFNTSTLALVKPSCREDQAGKASATREPPYKGNAVYSRTLSTRHLDRRKVVLLDNAAPCSTQSQRNVAIAIRHWPAALRRADYPCSTSPGHGTQSSRSVRNGAFTQSETQGYKATSRRRLIPAWKLTSELVQTRAGC